MYLSKVAALQYISAKRAVKSTQAVTDIDYCISSLPFEFRTVSKRAGQDGIHTHFLMIIDIVTYSIYIQ